MSDKEIEEIKKKLGINNNESDVATAIREIGRTHETIANALLQAQATQAALFERILVGERAEKKATTERLLAMFSPNALKLTATLERAGRSVGAPAPTDANKVSPDRGAPLGAFDGGDEDDGKRVAVDMETVLADSSRFSSAGFKPPTQG